MLWLLFGSSAAGKTFALNAVRARTPRHLAIHDFDEIGIPPYPTRRFRHEANETWVRMALDYQAQGFDLLLAGQTPFGELLATPSAPLLDGLSACLLDCDDTTRASRLRERGPEWWAKQAGDLTDYLNWAAWMRRHVEDPRWMPEVMKEDGSPEMRWERWTDWRAGDPRWCIRVIDTSNTPVERVADALWAWIEEERALVDAGTHPLVRWANDDRSDV